MPTAHRAAAALALVLLSACRQAYPPDTPVMDPMRLTQPQRLDAMNDLGRDAQPDRRWRYALQAGCVLQVALHAEGQAPTHLRVALHGKVVHVPFDQAAQLHAVQLAQMASADDSAVTVVQTVQWADGVRMRGLLQAIQRDCPHDRGPATATPAHG